MKKCFVYCVLMFAAVRCSSLKMFPMKSFSAIISPLGAHSRWRQTVQMQGSCPSDPAYRSKQEICHFMAPLKSVYLIPHHHTPGTGSMRKYDFGLSSNKPIRQSPGVLEPGWVWGQPEGKDYTVSVFVITPQTRPLRQTAVVQAVWLKTSQLHVSRQWVRYNLWGHNRCFTNQHLEELL